MGIVIRFRERAFLPQSNMHLTFMNLSDPLNFYRDEGEERLLAGNFHRCIGCLMIPPFQRGINAKLELRDRRQDRFPTYYSVVEF